MNDIDDREPAFERTHYDNEHPVGCSCPECSPDAYAAEADGDA